MEFSINGRTFDTATSTTAAISRGMKSAGESYDGYELRWEDVLYRTAEGAFFVHEHHTNKSARGGKPIITDETSELTPEQAIQWIRDRGAVVIDAEGLHLPDDC